MMTEKLANFAVAKCYAISFWQLSFVVAMDPQKINHQQLQDFLIVVQMT
jgi:hypothetical protein